MIIDAAALVFLISALKLTGNYFSKILKEAIRVLPNDFVYTSDDVFPEPHPHDFKDFEAFYIPKDFVSKIHESIIMFLGGPPKNLLDYCCGTGNLGLPFWAKGSNVTFCDVKNYLPLGDNRITFVPALPRTIIKNRNGTESPYAPDPFRKEEKFQCVLMNPPFEDYRIYAYNAMRHSDVIFGIAKTGRDNVTMDYIHEFYRKKGWAILVLDIAGSPEFDFAIPAYSKEHMRTVHIPCFLYIAYKDKGSVHNPCHLIEHVEEEPEVGLGKTSVYGCSHNHTCKVCKTHYSHAHADPRRQHSDMPTCPNSKCSEHHVLAVTFNPKTQQDGLRPRLAPLRHRHVCMKCGGAYQHTHPAKGANHRQFAFQCPFVSCRWYYGRGDATEAMNHTKSQTETSPLKVQKRKTAMASLSNFGI